MSTPYIGQELYFWYSESKRSEVGTPIDSLPICAVPLPTNEDKLEWLQMHYTHFSDKPIIISDEYTFLGLGRHFRDGREANKKLDEQLKQINDITKCVLDKEINKLLSDDYRKLGEILEQLDGILPSNDYGRIWYRKQFPIWDTYGLSWDKYDPTKDDDEDELPEF